MKKKTNTLITLITLIALLITIAGFAYGDSAYLQIGNDLFDYVGNNQDRHYTHGTRLGWIDHDTKKWWFLDDHFDGYEADGSYAIAQLMYTPNDIEETELIVDDRPYAGWLYFGYGRNYSKYRDNGTARQIFSELQLGMVGPSSYAEETQIWVHEQTDSDEPMGWDNQLHNELGINFILQLKDRFPVWGQHIDFTSHYGGAIGNVQTLVNVGGSFRLGHKLPKKFHVNKMEPTPRNVVKDTVKWLGFDESYFYVDVDGRLMARNIFLDGNTFEDSHSVDKEYFVGDVEAGVAIAIYKFDLIVGYVIRSKEFKGQDDYTRFGSIRMIYNF